MVARGAMRRVCLWRPPAGVVARRGFSTVAWAATLYSGMETDVVQTGDSEMHMFLGE